MPSTDRLGNIIRARGYKNGGKKVLPSMDEVKEMRAPGSATIDMIVNSNPVQSRPPLIASNAMPQGIAANSAMVPLTGNNTAAAFAHSALSAQFKLDKKPKLYISDRISEEIAKYLATNMTTAHEDAYICMIKGLAGRGSSLKSFAEYMNSHSELLKNSDSKLNDQALRKLIDKVSPTIIQETLSIIEQNQFSGREKFASLTTLQKHWHSVYEQVMRLSKGEDPFLGKLASNGRTSEAPTEMLVKRPIPMSITSMCLKDRPFATGNVFKRVGQEENESHSTAEKTSSDDSSPESEDSESLDQASLKRAAETATEGKALKKQRIMHWGDLNRSLADLVVFLQQDRAMSKDLDLELKQAQIKNQYQKSKDDEEDRLISKIERITSLLEKCSSEALRKNYEAILSTYQDQLIKLCEK